MKIYFSIIFLLLGLPIIFSLETLMNLSKTTIYSLIGIILFIALIDVIKNRKINVNVGLLFLFLLSLGVLFLFIVEANFTKQFIEIDIIVFTIFISLFYKQIDDLLILKTSLIIGALSIILIFISTPLSMVYWQLHGGRLYIGETNNPNLVSFVSLMYTITAIYTLNKINFNFIYKTLIIIITLMALYLYFMSFSKSSVIGFLFVLIYFTMRSKFKLHIKYIILSTIFAIVIIRFTEIDLKRYIDIIANSLESLLYGNNENMSAYIRHENFKLFFDKYLELNLFGKGLNTFRLDSPILQMYIDLGLIFAIFFFISTVLYPLFLIFTKNIYSIHREYAVIMYLFYLPNLFFHGTPYEWNTWLPTILFYMLFSVKEKNYVITNNHIHI